MSCAEFSIGAPSPLVVRLPGGASISGVTQGSAPTDLDVIRALSGQVAALLGPYQGIFNVIEAITLVLETVQVIPEAIATLSPGKITSKLSKLAAKVSSLASFIPALSIPILAADIILVVARNNDALRQVILSLQAQSDGAAAIEVKATALDAAGYPVAAAEIRLSGACLSNQVTERMAALTAGQGPLDSLIGLINSLLGLVPGVPIPPLPTVGSLPPDPGDALVFLDAVDIALDPIQRALAGI